MRRPWMRSSSAWHAVMFACAMSCVSGLAERVDAADVVGVALREDDVARRRGRDRVVVALVRAGLEPHAGVHDDAPVVGGDRGTSTTSRVSTRCRRPCRSRPAPTPGPTAKKSGWLRTYSLGTPDAGSAATSCAIPCRRRTPARGRCTRARCCRASRRSTTRRGSPRGRRVTCSRSTPSPRSSRAGRRAV